MNPRITLRDVAARMPYSKSDLARRADVSRTTSLAVTADPSRARVDTLRELALALGYEISIELQPASDPLAAAAARALLGDTAVGDVVSPGALEDWIDRLRRYSHTPADGDDDGSSGEPLARRIMSEAARVAAAHHRPGRVMFSGRNDADRLVSVGRASEADWVLSGAAALEALGADSGKTTVFWTTDPDRTSKLFADTHRRVNIHTAADVIVAPGHPSVFAGAETIEDVNLVTPVQGMIDAIAAGGADRRNAENLLRKWS